MQNKFNYIKNNIFAGLIIAIICTSAHAFVPVDENSQWRMSLNGQWRFMLDGPGDIFHRGDFDDSGWATINVPGNWELQGFEEPKYGSPSAEHGLYRRQFTVDPKWRGRRIIIRFEGVLFSFQFWVNGKDAGSFASAYNRSEFDITDLVKFEGTNTLAVRVDRHGHGWQFDTNDAWALSGIYRDVEMFSVGDIHVKDFTVKTTVKENWSSATVSCDFEIAGKTDSILKATLIDPSGKVSGVKQIKRGENRLTFQVDNPQLWSAESPALYELKVQLAGSNGPLHTFTKKIGIREVTIDGVVLKVNHRPIKLRGVNHHDIHPEVGRAMRMEHYRQDVELMKAGNINTVRTSHYPPHPAFLSLCDEYGLYVIDEVPFGRGEENLYDESYLDNLLMRAEVTVERDKNHPSVIIWSVGNENLVTPMVIETVKKVKQLDDTRPTLLPGPLERGQHNPLMVDLPDSVDIIAPHYPHAYPPEEPHRWALSEAAAANMKCPILTTEYTHSLGVAFEGLKDRWEFIEQNDGFAGGCIWHFQDQGLLRKVNDRDVVSYSKGRLHINPGEILDSHGSRGTDGIVYADRFPQVDYWITRKVYSPIVIPANEMNVTQGRQRVEITVLNRYDFTDLSSVTGKWKLMRDGKKKKSGKLKLSCAPHQKTTTAIDLNLADDLDSHDYWLELDFTDTHGHAVTEHSIRLLRDSRKADLKKRLTDMPVSSLQVNDTPGSTSISHPNFCFQVDKEKGSVTIVSPATGKTILTGLVLRVGREPSMAEHRAIRRNKIKYWEKPLLCDPQLLDCRIDTNDKDNVTVAMKLQYAGREGQSVIADVNWMISSNGWIDVEYQLTPKNVKDRFLEIGLAFELDKKIDQLAWLGDGPFNSYPGQSEASRHGVWNIKPAPISDPKSRYYPGNRTSVDLAAVTDADGSGIGVFADGAIVSLEPSGDAMVFSHLLAAAGKGTKVCGETLYPVLTEKIVSSKSQMRFVILSKKISPQLFKDFFGGK